jgi:hypothetical protein
VEDAKMPTNLAAPGEVILSLKPRRHLNRAGVGGFDSRPAIPKGAGKSLGAW